MHIVIQNLIINSRFYDTLSKRTLGRSNMSQSLHVQSAHLLLTKAQDSTPVHEEAAAQHETNTDEGTCH